MKWFRLSINTCSFLLFVPLFSIPLPAQPIAVSWTFGNIGSSSYRLDGFEPSDSEFGTIGSADPTLTLELGQRYEVKVTRFSAHPLDVLAKGSSAGQDRVLLSMGSSAGSFEADPDVNWEDLGGGVVRFTVTKSLVDAMNAEGRNPGYRCRPHRFSMRGDFEITGLPLAQRIPPSPIAIGLHTVAEGLTSPLDLVPDLASDKLFVVDQSGLVQVIEEGQLQADPLLDVSDRLVTLGFFETFDENDFDERGLLGFAQHPAYNKKDQPGYRQVYTYTSEPLDGDADFTVDVGDEDMNHQSVIAEWQVSADGSQVDVNSRREVLRIDQPQFNHDGGDIAFGPDGYLYIALGDGGAADDDAPGHGDIGNGQDINTILGSIVRIDPLDPALTEGSRNTVSANGAYRVPWDNPFVGVDGIDEIYAYGLRNPYRFNFDPVSGMLIAGDVGQGLIEEINIIRKGGNYGWKIKEGSFAFDPEGVNIGQPLPDPNLIDPVAQYDHDDGLSVIGGHMYYGSEVPALRGLYVFGEFSLEFFNAAGRILVADLFTGKIQELLIGPEQEGLGLFVKGVGQDRKGDVYILASSALGPYGTGGVVLKIVGPPAQP